MKKILFLCLLLFGCEIGMHPRTPVHQHSYVGETPTVVVSVGSPYDDYYSPVWCDEYCCLWEWDDYYSVCEEYWCNYYDGYGWQLEHEQCYPI